MSATPGSIGTVTTVLLGCGPDGIEKPVPVPGTGDGQGEMCQLYGLDGSKHSISRWQPTRVAAEAATRRAAAEKLETLAAISAANPQEDEPSTIADLLCVYRVVRRPDSDDVASRSFSDIASLGTAATARSRCGHDEVPCNLKAFASSPPLLGRQCRDTSPVTGDGGNCCIQSVADGQPK